ncbi:ninjurin-2-like [Saccoglossus kowalevskii]|uniref:Ninjurin-2-like n=1 Tax=Saccoglossus kowalevskii TaxID=10224 RepID=A0ABM0GV91_SACKO|nr:PREDICTED: ninjurin-2-like [Saccoglossus kowalevskii]
MTANDNVEMKYLDPSQGEGYDSTAATAVTVDDNVPLVGASSPGTGAGPSGQPAKKKGLFAKKTTKFNPASFSTTKNVSAGLTDFALLTRNCTSLRSLVIAGAAGHMFFWAVFTFLVLSIVLQVINGILSLVAMGKNMEDEEEKEEANDLNKASGVISFFINVVNVGISGFN